MREKERAREGGVERERETETESGINLKYILKNSKN